MDTTFIGVILTIGSLIFSLLYLAMTKRNPPVQEMDHLPLQAKYPEPLMTTSPSSPAHSSRERLYATAVASLGTDMSPADIAPDSLACAESINGVFKACFGEPIGTGSALTSTTALWKLVQNDTRFEVPDAPLPGDIVISPTGTSTHGARVHGHVGVWGKNDVMSNDSNTGLWTDNYTHDAWYNVFTITLGFPVYFFRVKDSV